MTVLRQRMIEDMQLGGLAERTRQSYVGAVCQLARYYGKSPDQISEEELRQYFLYLKNDKQYAPSSCMVALCGIKYFYDHTIKRPWPLPGFYQAAANIQVAGGVEPGGSTAAIGLSASGALPGLFEYDLCLRFTFARRYPLAGAAD